MLLRPVEYGRPATVAAAVAILASRDNARVLAGGQTLVNVMKLRVASPDVLVDIADIPGLDEISVAGDGTVELGAMATYDAIAGHTGLAEVRPILGQVASVIADQQVRNRGTLGGNVCANDPTNHFPPILAALGATMTIAGRDGERAVAVDDFFEGVYMTAVGPGEMLLRIGLPPPATGEGAGFASLTTGKEGTGIVNVAVSLRCNGTIEAPRVVVGCVAATPLRATRMEAALDGTQPTEANVRLAAEGLGAALDPPADVHASADYRRHVAEVMAVRATMQAIDRALGR
jgi:aerobic carbon-monoxide dehydrogenase medium subunit